MDENGFPEIIYKYRDWNNQFHKEIIVNRVLYLASPNDFNDPFDCRLAKNYLSLQDPEQMKRYQMNTLRRQIPRILKERRNLKESLNEMKKRLSDLPKFQQEANELYFKSQDEHYGVISFSMVWDNILLWSHYGDNHKGFCIGLYEKGLRDSNKFGVGGPVSYKESHPFIDPVDDFMMENYIIETHTKAVDWAYEKEFRLSKTFFPKKPTVTERKVVFNPEDIAEIIIGLKTDESTKEQILNSLPLENIPVYKIQQKPFQFKVERVRIN